MIGLALKEKTETSLVVGGDKTGMQTSQYTNMQHIYRQCTLEEEVTPQQWFGNPEFCSGSLSS